MEMSTCMCCVVALALMACSPQACGHDIFSSTAKIRAMLASEPLQLAGLKDFLQTEGGMDSFLSDKVHNPATDNEMIEEFQFENMEDIRRFYDTALARQKMLWANEEARGQFAVHPTNAFFAIKHSLAWHRLRHKASLHCKEQLLRYLPDVITAGHKDIMGAAAAIIRLQRTYGLLAADVMRGNVAGRLGMPLTSRDALLVAQAGRLTCRLPEAIQWLELLLSTSDVTSALKADALAELGLVKLRLGQRPEAEAVYQEGVTVEPHNRHLKKLGWKLKKSKNATSLKADAEESLIYEENDGSNSTVSRLCRRNSSTSRLLPYHLCRWRCSLLPWLRYKEEVLSLAPYASIFHDVIADWEADGVKRLAVEAGMARGKVINADTVQKRVISSSRTGALTFLDDSLSPLIKKLSARVQSMTGLNTQRRFPAGIHSSEPFQVVNYGIGGHSAVHSDGLRDRVLVDNGLKHAGDRLATFLIYLSDVELGGRTAFPRADISAPAVKGTALFWYNYTPDGDLDQLAVHTGCPVALGEKWVMNKWIWDYGNTFNRPCPRQSGSNQWELEKMMHTTCPV